MCANDGAIDDRTDLVDPELKLLKDGLPVALLRPVVEPVVDRLPRAKALRKVSPWHARLGAEEYGFDEEPIAPRSFRSSLPLGKNGLQSTPLSIGERVSVHPDL